LLGNPGVGKTTELKKTFEILWEEREKNNTIPYYINIKNFRTTTKIEDLLKIDGIDWKEIPSIILIFDGLDEISQIHEFISELEIFIVTYRKLKIKYLISCRTNIYNKYL